MHTLSDFFKSTLGTKTLTVVFAIVLIFFLAQIVKRIIPTRIEDTGSRYRARKFVNIIGYAAAFAVLLIVFGNQLSALNVVLGVAGAGVAFAFQEVIASFATR